MASPIDASWNNNVLSDNNLNQTTYGQGTSFPSTWRTDRVFLRSDERKFYQNTGTEASPTWSEIGGGGAQLKEITTAETFNPEKQSGLTHLIFEKDGVNTGNLKWYIDGTLQDTFDSTSTGQYNKIIKPSTSLQFVSAGGAWTDTQYNGIMRQPSSGISDHHGFDISPNGDYQVRVGDRSMISQSPTTAYDISSASSNGTDFHSGSLGGKYAYSVTYGDSGNSIFVGISNQVYKFDLPYAYYWTGSSISGGLSQSYNVTNSSALGSGQVWAVQFNDDGTKMFTNLNSNPQNIYEHELTTAWDLTTASYSGNSYATGMSSSDMRAFAMSKDGVYIYTTDGAGGSTLLHRHEMSTPFDITTATKDSTTIDISTLIGVSTKLNAQMAVSNNNAYLYVAYQGGGSDRQYRLELQTVYSGNFRIKVS